MATQIDWGLLRQTPNIAESFAQGQAAGELQQRKKATQDILASYAANPSGPVPNALAIYDPHAYAALSQNSRQQAVADRQTADALRQTQARTTAGSYIRQNMVPGAGVSAGGAAAPVPATTNENGDIIVSGTKPAAPTAPAVTMADVFEKDPEMAQNLAKFMGDLGENDRKAFAQKWGVGAAVAQAASHLPADQVTQFIDDHAPILKHAGFTDDELGGFDAHPENLRAVVAIGVGADKIVADDRSAAGQAVTVRGQDVSAATSRRGQDISASTAIRGQDVGAATARSGQAVTMRGQDLAAAGRNGLKPAQVQTITSKLTDLKAIENQLNRAEAALNKTNLKGSWAGILSGRFDSSASAADAAVAGLSPLIRKLTRTPGEGSMSDYESRLSQSSVPGRGMSDAARAEAFAGLRDLIRGTREGYSDMLGTAPAAAPAAGASKGWKVVK